MSGQDLPVEHKGSSLIFNSIQLNIVLHELEHFVLVGEHEPALDATAQRHSEAHQTTACTQLQSVSGLVSQNFAAGRHNFSASAVVIALTFAHSAARCDGSVASACLAPFPQAMSGRRTRSGRPPAVVGAS